MKTYLAKYDADNVLFTTSGNVLYSVFSLAFLSSLSALLRSVLGNEIVLLLKIELGSFAELSPT